MVTDLEVITFIKELFQSDKRRWCKGTAARDASGYSIKATAPSACSFCMTGAIERYSESDAQKKRLRKLVGNHIPSGGAIESFNDKSKTTVHDVTAILGCVEVELKHAA